MSDSLDAKDADPFKIIEESFLFERDWYLHSYPDVAASGGDPLEHYILHGVREGRNPNRLFDTRWYLAKHLRSGAGQTLPLLHYVLHGAAMGCDPHPYFPTQYYLHKFAKTADEQLTPLADYLSRVVPLEPESLPRFSPYDVVRATQACLLDLERDEIARHLHTMILKPIFIVLIDGDDDLAADQTRRSLDKQLYSVYATCVSFVQAGRIAHGKEFDQTYLIWLDAGDVLEPDALYRYACELNIDPLAHLLYSDYDYQDFAECWCPIYKPDWSPDYLESFDYIGAGVCAKLTEPISTLDQVISRYDLVLRITEPQVAVIHVERVLLHAAAPGWSLRSDAQAEADFAALRGRLARTGRRGHVTANVSRQRSYDVRLDLRREPLVSMIIPTAARVVSYEGEKVDLISQCLESIFEVSTYTNIELIIVDNGDLDRRRLTIPDNVRVRFVTYALSEINIAKKINLGASYAVGELLLILNDDIKPLTADWLQRLIGHFEKPHVGLVGAKLLYPNGKIQHAGVAACDGAPEHVNRGKPGDDIGYEFSIAGVRNYLAVTGAVVMTTAAAFRAVGGFSEEFPVDYNDIDFSYKYIALNSTVVYEPKCVLLHYESISFVKPPRPQDEQNFYVKWGFVANDPYYNEYCLSKHPPMFDIAFTHRRH